MRRCRRSGSYQGGKLLFLGLGTGLGSAMVVDDTVLPMELAHLPYRKGTFEDYVGLRAMQRDGKGGGGSRSEMWSPVSSMRFSPMT